MTDVLFKRNVSFLSDTSAAGITVTGALEQDVLTALTLDEPFPDRPIELGDVLVRAKGGKDIEFGKGDAKVSFSASASAFAGVGVYPDAESLLDAVNPDQSLAPGLILNAGDGFHFLLIRWGYDARASASGAVALGAGGAFTFSADGKREATFAVVRRLEKTLGARTSLQATADAWMLPRQVSSIDDLEPGTWLIAETDGSIAVKLGAQFGYDFNWVREAKLGGLTGDIGLRIQLGASVALGFEASGKYAVVVGRDSSDSNDKRLRLRLFKLNKKGWNFALSAKASVQGDFGKCLPEQFDDFVSAIFGVHGPQVVETLKAVEKWTDPTKPLSGLLAEAGIDYGKELLERLTGIDAKTAFDAARSKVLKFLDAWDNLPSTTAGAVWNIVGRSTSDKLDAFRDVLAQIASVDLDAAADLIVEHLESVEFFALPVGEWLQSLSDNVLTLLDRLSFVQDAARKTLEILDAGDVEDVLKKLQAFVSDRLSLGNLKWGDLKTKLTQADFNRLDGWLKAKLGEFLDSSLDLAKLENIRKAISMIVSKRQVFYEKAVTALNRKYDFALAYTYQKSTTRTALLDIEFDFGADNPAQVGALLAAALGGRFDTVLTTPAPGVKLNQATLTHEITRRSHVEVTLPYFARTVDHLNQALARVNAVDEDDGRILVYDLDAKDVVTVKNRRNSSLTVGLSASFSPNVRRWSDLSASYAYSFKQAVKNMRRSHLQYQLKPYVMTYFPDAFAGSAGRPAGSFDTWIGDLDDAVENVEHNGTDTFGNTLISLDVSLPPAFVQAWLTKPADDKAYMDMSRRLQAKLKELIPFFYFQDIGKYKDVGNVGAVGALLVYASIPPSTKTRLNGDQLKIDTDEDVYWNWPDDDVRSAMISHATTRTNLTTRLKNIHDLLAEAGLASTAAFYAPSEAKKFLDGVRVGVGETNLRNLLFVEAEVVEGAAKAARDIARFVDSAADHPTEAVKALADFGSDITQAFNAKLTSLYGGDGLRVLGTTAFVEAAAALSPVLAAAKPRAMLGLTVLKGGAAFPPAGFPNESPPVKDDIAVQARLVSVD